ncbi:predicted protein, partial [Arabidopsis lyrata subsp. lyrata]
IVGEDQNESSEEDQRRKDDLPKVEFAVRSTGYPRRSRNCRRRRRNRLAKRILVLFLLLGR